MEAMEQLYRPFFERVYHVPLPSSDEMIEPILAVAGQLAPMAVDGPTLLNDALARGKKLLAEGAQGILLDVDFGTYPYVTSSNPSPGGVCCGLGVGPTRITRIIGVIKAYTTRVGEGPMPTEFEREFGDAFREWAGEFGATTGRPRRCGWFDVPAVRRSLQLADASELALTNLDQLDRLDEIKICVEYESAGKRVGMFPFGVERSEELKPVYETLPGWRRSIQEAAVFEELPPQARAYIQRLEHLLGVTIATVSVGPRRAKTIRRQGSFF